MKTFNFNLSEGTIKNLSDINEDYIKIKHIASDNFDNLEQQFVIKTTYPDKSVFSNILSCGAYITPYTREPKINIDFPIEDCQFTKIEAVKKDTKAKYTFHYETLADTLKGVTSEEKETKNQIENEIKEWVNKVEQLFDKITEWLKPYEQNIKTSKRKTLISEEISGAYNISILDIVILDKLAFQFLPIGTFILGGKGRIDIRTNFRLFDSYMLVLQPSEKTEKWYLIRNRDNFTKKEFSQSQLLMLIDNAIKTRGN